MSCTRSWPPSVPATLRSASRSRIPLFWMIADFPWRWSIGLRQGPENHTSGSAP
jgi:hypothetical protein